VQRRRTPFKAYVSLGIIILLVILSILILWQLLTANYPTHSDVFFMGVEAGALGIVLLLSLFLIGLFTYRLMSLMKSPKMATNLV
jgi:hypothetical protein